MELQPGFSCDNDPDVCVPDTLLKLNSIAPSGWDSPPLADDDNLSTHLLTSVERDLDIAKFQFNMTDEEINEFFADSATDGGLQSRQEDGLTIIEQ